MLNSNTANARSTAACWVTLVDFSPSQASNFEDALRKFPDTSRIGVRCVKMVSDASFSAALIHAIVLAQKITAQMSKGDMDTLRSITKVETCRIYLLNEADSLASIEVGFLDEFIQRTRSCSLSEVANEIINFFREAGRINRISTILAFRDKVCIIAYNILKYLWPISYIFATAHILNALNEITGRGAWLSRHADDYLVTASTFFGAFFIVHFVVSIFRNCLFAIRFRNGRTFSAFAMEAVGFGTAVAATAYSVAITDPRIFRISICAVLIVAVYACYMYARRIRGECTSLSQLQVDISKPDRREDILKSTGEQRFGHSAFPLFPFKSRALFISYMQGSRWSSETADQVQDWATKHGFEVFLDRSSIPSGTRWRRLLLRAVSECVFFVAVIDGNSPITEWVLAESLYAAQLRKSIGKPRILLLVYNAQKIIKDRQNPIHLTYLDVFQLSPYCWGAAILPVDAEHELTEQSFIFALKDIKPMSLLFSDYKNIDYKKAQTVINSQKPSKQFTIDEFEIADRAWKTSVLLIKLLDAEGRSKKYIELVQDKCLDWIRSDNVEKKVVGLNTLRYLCKGNYISNCQECCNEIMQAFLRELSLPVKLSASDFLGAMGYSPNPLTQVSEYEVEKIIDYRAQLMKQLSLLQRAYAAEGVHVDLAEESLGKTYEAALQNVISRIDNINIL